MFAPPALAGADLFLQWDDCPPAGTALRTFACDTNSGSETLIYAFQTDWDIPQVTGMTGNIQMVFPTAVPPVSDWWNFTACRPSAAIQLGYTYPSTCVNPWPAGSLGGIPTPGPDPTWPGRYRIRLLQGAPVPFTLAAGVRYYGFKVILSHAKSTGSEACGGCSMPAVLTPSGIGISTEGGAHDTGIGIGAKDQSIRFARWQCDGIADWSPDTATLLGYPFTNCTVPARRPTWGSIQSLYR